MTKAAKQIWNWFTGLLVALMVLLAIALAGVRVVGLHPYVVLSGSMEPAFPVGSLIYVKSVDSSELQAGDPITFLLAGDTVATHRIVEVLVEENDPETIRYVTRGDANSAADAAPVPYENVLGKPVFMIPYLGYVANYIQKPPGIYLAVSAGAVLLLLVFLPDLLTGGEPEKKAKGGKYLK